MYRWVRRRGERCPHYNVLGAEFGSESSSPIACRQDLGSYGVRGNCLFIAKLHSFRSRLWAITPVSEGQRGDFPCLNSDGYGVVVLVQTYGCLSCQQHFSLWGDFPPRGRCSAWRHSGCYNWAGGCFWPLACSCQGCGKTSYHAQHSPHHRELCGPECHRPCSGPLPS